ncbi:hypothetical protein [Marinobacterium weihaiense]|uniref:Uncharacterized protein n=1 Tax=Marinobacterium weihaiense TaxID=2851016 RepID=A0ABS6MCU9_9GAMM|nr:hypothetical protein [Marinobacterium weihaiense]MBV0933709.1 hypothetical protein [Marinobacterium weihaiense]
MEQDWPVNKDWQKGQSRPEQVNLRFYSVLLSTLVYLGVMAVINITQWPAIAAAIEDLIASGYSRFDPLLVLPGMLLLGLPSLPRMSQAFVRWRRQRSLVMTLDPVPAALDGELGGRLILPLNLSVDSPVKVTLNCMRRVVTKGNNAGVRDELLWQTPAVVRQMPSVKGTRIEFCASLCTHQPPSRFEQGRRTSWWAVHVEVPGGELDATFAVPVSATADRQTSEFRFSERARQQHVAQVAQTPVSSWQQAAVDDNAMSINFPAGRSGKAAWVLMLMGLVFTGVAGFMAWNVWSELGAARTRYFAVMVQGMIMLGFGLFGPGMLLGGLYMQLNRLKLDANAQALLMTRRFLGFSSRRSVAVADIDGLAERVVGRMGQGVESELDYAIDAYLHNGQRVRLADGVQGQVEIEQLMEGLRQVTGISHRPDPNEYRLQRSIPPTWVLWLPVVLKSSGALVFVLAVLAFMADFW